MQQCFEYGAVNCQKKRGIFIDQVYYYYIHIIHQRNVDIYYEIVDVDI